MADSKRLYSETLKKLENISDEIHERRAQILTKSLKREPGVGAELSEDQLNGTNIDNLYLCILVSNFLFSYLVSESETKCLAQSNHQLIADLTEKMESL